MVTPHADPMAVINAIYCFWCGRVRDWGCYCYRPNELSTSHHMAVERAQTPRASAEQLRTLAAKPPKRRAA